MGSRDREEIDIIDKGGNYGWPFREGLIEGVEPQPETILGILTDPVIDIAHPEARAIIGGYVYRAGVRTHLLKSHLIGV